MQDGRKSLTKFVKPKDRLLNSSRDSARLKEMLIHSSAAGMAESLMGGTATRPSTTKKIWFLYEEGRSSSGVVGEKHIKMS